MSRQFPLLAACLLALSGWLPAQVSTSRVLGTITDTTGSAVPAASIELRNEGTGVVNRTTSGSSGTYVFDAIPTGSYALTVEAKGFKRYITTNNQLTIGQPMTVNPVLEVGAVTESVQVSASAELVQTSTSGNIGNVLSEKMIKDLPIVGTRGRNPLELVNLQPGVVSGANTGGGVHVHGARDRAWNFTLDGIDNNETSAGGSNFAPARTNPDSLAEYRVVTSNPTAEFGRNSGAQVVLVTKSGTNEFHGNGFWFYRTPRLNANEWENNLQNRGKPQFVQNIYGGSIGGPIVRNRAFFFANIQRLAASTTVLTNRTVYTQSARQGLWRYVLGGRTLPFGVTGASIDANGNPLPNVNVGTYNVVANDPLRLGFDPRIRGEIDATPLPNNFAGGDGLNTALYTFNAGSFERQQDNTVKIDYVINDKNSFYGRATWGYQNSVCDTANSGQELFPGTGCIVNTERTPRNFAFNWRSVITPSLTNELIVGVNRFTFNFPTIPAERGDIYFTSAPVAVIGTQLAIGNARRLTTWQFVDNATWVKNSHVLKFGVNLRFGEHLDDRGSIAGENANQGVDFSTTLNPVDRATFGVPTDIQQANDRPALENSINFLLGRVGRTARGFASDGSRYVDGNYNFAAKFNEYDFYFQDTWKVSRRLTLDLGLRWEIKLAPTEGNNRIRRPDQPLVFGAAPTSTARWVTGSLFRDQFRNFGPSLGFAYDPFGDGKTAVRGNYRMAFDRLNTFSLSSAVFQNLPGITLAAENTTFGPQGGRLRNLPQLGAPNVNPESLAQPAPFSNRTITVADPNMGTPTTHMWSFGVQREILRNTVLSVDYIGRRAYNLYAAYNANQVDITNNGFLDAFNTARAGGESAVLDRITATDSRRTPAESGAAFVRRLFPVDVRQGSVANLAASLAQNNAAAANIFRRFPQFASVNVIDTNAFSTYHGLEVQVLKRYSNNLEAQFSWTWSRSLDTGSFDPAFTIVATGTAQSASSTPFDIANRRLNYARSDFDRTHVFQSYWVYDLPFGKTGNGFVQRTLGGWQVAGSFYYYTGRPFTVYSGFNTFSNVVSSPANCDQCPGTLGTQYTDVFSFYLNPAERQRFAVPAPGVPIGSSGRNRFQTEGQFNVDFSAKKFFRVTERTNFEVRADVTNFTNTPQWGVPTADIQSATFGRLFTPIANRARKIQLGAKFNF